jgi:hypothetical protein
MTDMSKSTEVFLGGSCFGANEADKSWRKGANGVMAKLEAAGVTFYNPEVDDWSPELVDIEAAAKANAETLLFVIDPQTRAIVSIMEALAYAGQGRDVVIVNLGNIADGTVIAGQTVTGRELKDLNRARSYLADLVKDFSNTVVFDSIDAAVEYLIEKHS